MVENNFEISDSDICLFKKIFPDNNVVKVILYIDDILVTSTNIEHISSVKKMLAKHFEIKDLGEAKKISRISN